MALREAVGIFMFQTPEFTINLIALKAYLWLVSFLRNIKSVDVSFFRGKMAIFNISEFLAV
jgi:hypothetical protein